MWSITIIVWIAFITTLLFWNIVFMEKSSVKLALDRGRSLFQQLLTMRLWNACHGGVYVLITDGMRPNQYLEDELRDVTAQNNMELTKINPAYMTRQLSEITKEQGKIQSIRR